jgi:hypothetical protein
LHYRNTIMARTMRTITTIIMGRIIRRNVLFFWGAACPVGVALVVISFPFKSHGLFFKLPVRSCRGSSYEQCSSGSFHNEDNLSCYKRGAKWNQGGE